MTLLRIGEVARIAGISPRAVRHYHRIGLLPEPARRPNGYRGYDIAAVVRLLRIRRLMDLGLSLEEVGAALADDDGRELREIIADIAAELAEREARIRRQRERLLELASRGGDLTVDAGLAEVFAFWDEKAGDHPAYARERRVAELMAATGSGDAVDRAMRGVMDDTRLVERGLAISRRFEELADDASQQAIDDVAVELIAYAREVTAHLPAGDDQATDVEVFLKAVGSDLNAAQRQVFQRLTGEIRRWAQR
ncbi:MerR family transcriptional regulator [Fodinicola acaciae]|uniref:helix-turn-helix domain-containing protein n=1 Tax=Fodinicola acaciae TaxID=2681555 RepID=UPI001C9E8C40|nr:MerR family transcriptional regulator [Fodinicola acaciae]